MALSGWPTSRRTVRWTRIVTSTMVGRANPRATRKLLRARLEQALEADGDRHGVVLATRHRQARTSPPCRSASLVGACVAMARPASSSTSARSSVDVLVKTRGCPASSVSMTEIASTTGSAAIRSCSVSRMSSGSSGSGRSASVVGGRSRRQPRRVDQVAVDVVLERAHFEVGHARHHPGHDERDQERQPRAQREVLKPFRHSGADLQVHRRSGAATSVSMQLSQIQSFIGL